MPSVATSTTTIHDGKSVSLFAGEEHRLRQIPNLNRPSQNEKLAATATGGIAVAGVPHFDDLHKKRQWQLEHMAAAFRVFARKGYTEGTAGHISVRDPINPHTFWINP